MRLNLNKTLRAALIAAITAVGTTLPQAQAEETYTVTLPASGTTPTWSHGHTNNNVGQLVTWAAGQNAGYYVGGNNNSYGNPGVSGEGTYTMLDNVGSVTLCGRSGVAGDSFVFVLQDQAMVGKTYDSLTFTVSGNTSNSLTMGGNFAVGVTGESLVSASEKLANVKTSGLTSVTLTFEDPFTFTESTKLIAAFRGDGGSATTAYTIQDIQITAHVASPPAPGENLTWAGSEGNNVLTSAVWDDGESKTADYSSSASLVFGSDGYKEVVINTAATAKSMEVQGSGYVFEAAADSSLTTKVKVVAGASLELTGEGAYTISTAESAEGASITVTTDATISTLTGAGDLIAGADSNVTVNALNSYTGNLSVTGGGSLALAGQLSGAYTKDITVSGGTLSISAGTSGDTFHKIIVGEGGTFDLKGKANTDYRLRYELNGGTLTNTGSATGAGNIQNDQISLGANSEVSGTADFNMIAPGYNTSYLNLNEYKLTKTGSNTIHLYNTHVNEGEIEVLEGAVNFRTDKTTSEVAADIILNGGNVTGKVKYTADTTLSAQKTQSTDLAVELNGHTLTLDAAEDATLTMAGAVTGSGSLVKTGAGAATIGGTIALSKAIDVQAGSLTLTGTYAIDNISGGGLVKDFVDDNGQTADNGFSRKSGSVTVYTQNGGTVNATGATFTLGTSTVTESEGVVTVDTTIDYTTLYVNLYDADFAAHQAYAQSKGSSITGVVLKDYTSVEKVSGTVGVTLAEGTTNARVSASGATTLSSISGWNNTLQIEGSGEVTMAGQTLTGSQRLAVIGTVSTTGALTVNSADASLLVAEDATLNVNGNANLTPVHGNVRIEGTLNISSELDLSKGKTSDVNLVIGSTGKVSANGMWMHSASSIELQEEGEFAIGGLSIVGKADGGISYLGAAGTDSSYSTTNANYQIANATVIATQNVTIGNTLVGVDVVTGEHNVVLNKNADSVTVSDGGSFFKGANVEVANGITVEDGGTIAGGVDATDVKIAAAGTATFLQGINEEGVQLGWFESTAVTNMKGEAAAYEGIHDTDMQVSTDVLMAESDSDVTVNNKLVVTEIMNGGLGTITVTNVDTQELQNVAAYSGDVTLQNVGADPIELPNLSLYGTTAAVYTDNVATADHEATVTITEVLEVEGGGTLLANLEMADGSSLLLDGAGDNALVLGSTLDLGTDIKLDAITLQALDAMSLGETLMLVKAADGTDFDYLGEAEWFGQVFSRSASGGGYDLIGDYSVLADADGFGLVKVSNTPEPTTGTLSLLALAALAARRRRH